MTGLQDAAGAAAAEPPPPEGAAGEAQPAARAAGGHADPQAPPGTFVTPASPDAPAAAEAARAAPAPTPGSGAAESPPAASRSSRGPAGAGSAASEATIGSDEGFCSADEGELQLDDGVVAAAAAAGPADDVCECMSDSARTPRAASEARSWDLPLAADFSARAGARDNGWVYQCMAVHRWELDAEALRALASGMAVFCFSCKVGDRLSATERAMFRAGLNISGFQDELKENNVPFINVDDPAEQRASTFFMVRGVYIFPGVGVNDIDLALLNNVQYHRECQPSSRTLPTRIWEDCRSRGDKNTFRITKTIIPLVLKITVQFFCSEVPQELLPGLSVLASGFRVDRALLMERTKRAGAQAPQDATKKVKSLLLFHALPNSAGVLVVNPTLIANSMVPRVIAAALDRVGALGASEVAETATRTLRYMHARGRTPLASPTEATGGASRWRRIRQPGSDDPSQYSSRPGSRSSIG
eukprot:TRINITY_DN18531_c0_g1_i1.p1 TRINITY_DN18531_c0_g1~~TRINITY_DN18531_c0_g1_i1.p1  ORF type:complete len:516 (+),score=134.95 TRINITY_DN18531_c0_g1_i1:133-1548(+)